MKETFLFKILEIENISILEQELAVFYERHRTVGVVNRKNKDGNTIMILSDPNKPEADSLGPLEKFTFVHLDSDRVMNHLPELQKYFIKNNLGDIERIAYVSTPPHSTNATHMDQGPEILALNFPLTDCSSSYTQFLKNNGRLEAVELIDTVKGIKEKRKFMKFVTDDPIEVGRYTLNGPVMLNIKQPHGVINHGPMLRAGISFRFKKDPWHLVED